MRCCGRGQVHRRTGKRIYVTERKFGVMNCLQLPGKTCRVAKTMPHPGAVVPINSCKLFPLPCTACNGQPGLIGHCKERHDPACRSSPCRNVLTAAGVAVEDVFTTDPKETCIHVTQWGFLGDTWPYFRPNFVNMEAARAEAGVDEVWCSGASCKVLSFMLGT